MKTKGVVILFIGLMVLVGGCTPVLHTPPSGPTVPSPPSTPPSTQPPTLPSITAPPVTVALDYFGIKSTHQPAYVIARNRIQLYVVVDDGKTPTKPFSYPSTDDGLPLPDFNLEALGEQIIFQTSSVGDHIRISALAYSCADKEATLSLGRALQAFEPSMGTLLDFYEKLPESKELIGWYEHTWYAAENWGATLTEYQEGNGDLKLWFRIWSDVKPQVTPKPRFIPDVKISVTLPSNVKKRPASETVFVTTYNTTLRIVNNESVDITVDWQAHSYITGDFDRGNVTVPKNGYKDITKPYYYTTAGIEQLGSDVNNGHETSHAATRPA